MQIVFLVAILARAWFEDGTFVNVGDNTGVPRSTITRRANEKGITPRAAMLEIGDEIKARKAGQQD